MEKLIKLAKCTVGLCYKHSNQLQGVQKKVFHN